MEADFFVESDSRPTAEGKAALITLFVFGTLKKGFPLHELALCGAPCGGACRTVARYPMLIAGPWLAPMMLPEPGGGHRVVGELYEIEAARLARIDAIESFAIPGNLRLAIEVEARRDRAPARLCVSQGPRARCAGAQWAARRLPGPPLHSAVATLAEEEKNRRDAPGGSSRRHQPQRHEVEAA